MALSTCPDCKKEFSTSAEACPHCGRPHKRRMSAGCLVGLLLAGAAIFSFFYFAPTAPPSQQQPTTTDSATDVPSPAAPGPTTDANAFDPALQPAGTYKFSLSAAGGDMPTISGTATVPDGTVLLINIKRPWLPDGQERLAQGLAACGDSCLPATADTVVRGGKFSSGPFSFAGKSFAPGVYPVEIFIYPNRNNATRPEGVNAMTNPVAISQIQVQEDVQP